MKKFHFENHNGIYQVETLLSKNKVKSADQHLWRKSEVENSLVELINNEISLNGKWEKRTAFIVDEVSKNTFYLRINIRFLSHIKPSDIKGMEAQLIDLFSDYKEFFHQLNSDTYIHYRIYKEKSFENGFADIVSREQLARKLLEIGMNASNVHPIEDTVPFLLGCYSNRGLISIFFSFQIKAYKMTSLEFESYQKTIRSRFENDNKLN